MTIEFIINHLWQSSCFALLAGLLALVLRRNSPKVRYWVWLAASLKFLVPFGLLVSMGSLVPRPVQQPASLPTPVFSNTLVQIAQPLSATPGITHTPLHWMPAAIGIVWALGFLAIALVRYRAWLRVQVALRAGVPVDLPIPVRALITPGAEEPGIAGFLRSVLVLPVQLLEHLNARQLGAILTHEMCHVRRRDNFFAAVHMAVEAIFWFNPLVWWIGSRMLEERELACDEEVLRAGCEPADYVQGILNVCRLYAKSPLPCISGVTGADIKKRLRGILAGGVAQELSRGRKAALATLGLAALAVPFSIGVWDAPALHAQSAGQRSLAGTWQGTVRSGDADLRIVIRISDDSAGLKALWYSIDRGPGSFRSSAVSVQDSNVKISFQAIDGIFEGKWSSDGNSLPGTWTRGETVPLNLIRATAETAWAIPEPAPLLKPMAADANPTCEVATIKPSRPDDQRLPTISIQGGRRLLGTNRSVMSLIGEAWRITPGGVVSAPAWLDTRYDLVCQPAGEGRPSLEQWDVMLQKLLAERFRFSFHWDKKEAPVYELTVSKNGSKLTASTSDPKGPSNFAMPALGRMRLRNVTTAGLASNLMGLLDRPVIDRTGISGHYDVALNWTVNDFQASLLKGAPAPADSKEFSKITTEFPDLFTALQDQLGLKLESTKGLVNFMVIDRIERPSEN